MNSLMSDSYHVPVMLSECLDGLILNPNGIYADLTFGGGGHASAILDRLENGKLFGFDQDPDSSENAIQFKDDTRFQFIDSNFRFFRKYLKMYGVTELDGVFADLGISSHQIDAPERGFSTRFNAVLDMRMNQEGDKTAEDVINNYSSSQLQTIFSSYGEVRNARTLANAIASARESKPIRTVNELNAICMKLAPRKRENKYLAQVYQSIRIEVNEELDALKKMLEESCKILKPGGRLVVMSYHSLEDRLVKNMIKYGNAEGNPVKDFYGNLLRPLKPINRKPITADMDELQRNRRSRSAKLRIAEKLEEND